MMTRWGGFFRIATSASPSDVPSAYVVVDCTDANANALLSRIARIRDTILPEVRGTMNVS